MSSEQERDNPRKGAPSPPQASVAPKSDGPPEGAEALRARLAAVVDSSDDAIISKTLDGIITTWNAGAERIFGYTAAEVIGKPVTILFPPELQNEEPGILAKLRRGERIEHYETVRVRKDGTRLDISLTVSPVKDSSGRIIGGSKIARDITDRKRAEQVMNEQSRLLGLLHETGKIIASQLELEQLVQSITDVATKLTAAEFGSFFYNVVNEKGESYMLYTLSGAKREDFEGFQLPRNTPVFNPTFTGEGMVRSDDITKDPRYGKVSPHHGMPKGHLPVRSYLAAPVVSRSGRVIGGLFFGHSQAGVFTEQSEKLLEGVAAQASVAIDNARLYETALRASEERKALLEAEKAARAEAERVNLLKDQFLATLSHELRTPLNSIVGWSQLLRTQPASEADVQEGLAVIERSGRVQAQLVSDLLDMSRIISGKMTFEVQRVDLQDVVKAAVAAIRQSAEAKNIRVQLLLDPSVGAVRGDPARLQQCLWNLLMNAIKFTPKGGRVQVSVAKVNSHVELSVSDTGQGIAPSFLPHLFERFRQADASTTRKHGGLGLGLSIVKNLVELHGGTVRASSPGEGKGATFYIDLPIMAAELPPSHLESEKNAAQRESPAHDPALLKGITILAVDDEPESLKLIQRLLEGAGARVLIADSAQEGFELLTQEKPNILLSDIGMPEEDGYSFIRRIRKLKANEGGHTPAAALTAFARTEDRTKALRAGYQIHVAKPVDPSELVAVVASLAMRG